MRFRQPNPGVFHVGGVNGGIGRHGRHVMLVEIKIGGT